MPINRIRFIIPNLHWRPDRWEWCRNTLLEQGVPAENIIRFPVWDGLRYVDSTGDHRNLHLLQNALADHFGTLPPCLRRPHDMLLTQYAWHASWYAILDEISRLPEDEYGCWLLDDWRLQGVTYDELLGYANILTAVCKRSWRRLVAIQIAHFPTETHTKRRRKVAECPMFQYGLSTYDEHAIILSSHGASFWMNHINHKAPKDQDWKMDPRLFLALLQNYEAQGGFFGIYPPHGQDKDVAWGFIRACAKAILCASPIYKYDTDRQMSKYLTRKG